jgi:hypothetical protein
MSMLHRQSGDIGVRHGMSKGVEDGCRPPAGRRRVEHGGESLGGHGHPFPYAYDRRSGEGV